MNKKRMNKRGQFFLIAALVIITLLISARAIYNVASSSGEDVRTYDLSKEIVFEGAQVLDHGIYTKNKEEIGKNIESLIANYSKANPESTILVLYGDREELMFIQFDRERSGGVGIDFGTNVPIEQEISSIKGKKGKLSPDEFGNVEIKLNDKTTVNEKIQEGQSIYIILKREKDGEEIVAF